MTILNNGTVKLEIDSHGAEMQSVTVNGEERLWDGNPAFWSGRAPVLFPICGGLPDDCFTYNGKEYHLPKHGFARSMDFEAVSATDISATFSLKSNAQTLAQYPWEFELLVTYSLRGSAIDIGYTVKNKSDSTMYFSIGSHEAYACPEGVEDYDIIFAEEETLETCDLEGNLLAKTATPVLKESRVLPMYDKYFAIDALIFKDVKSRKVTLRNRKTGKSVFVTFEGCPYLLLWKKPEAGYLCIEPWTGIPPTVGSSKEITKKEGITALPAQDTFKIQHSLYF